MSTEVRGNYLPEGRGPLLTRDKDGKTYLNCGCNYLYFYFFVAEVMSNYLTTEGLKKNFSTSGGPLRPEARGIFHYHMVNPALSGTKFEYQITQKSV